MSQPFAALENRLNTAAIRHVSNASASAYNAQGVLFEFNAVFDNGYASVLGGLVGDTAPTLQCLASDVADVDWGSAITVNGVHYTVSRPAPDSTGWIALTLREA